MPLRVIDHTGHELLVNANSSISTSSPTGSPAQSSVASSATTTTLLAANTNRLGATIFNESTQVLYLKLGATASSTSYTVRVPANGSYDVPFNYTGIIYGIWAAANGNARITEHSSPLWIGHIPSDWGPDGGSDGGVDITGYGSAIAATWPADAFSLGTKTTISGSAGVRLRRTLEASQYRQLTYTASVFVPVAPTLTGDPATGQFWNLIQTKARAHAGPTDPIWTLTLNSQNRDGTGGLYPTVIWSGNLPAGPHSGQTLGRTQMVARTDLPMPIGRSFQVQMMIRQAAVGDYTGQIRFSFDGVTIYDDYNVVTGYFTTDFGTPWNTYNDLVVNLYSDGILPDPFSVYFNNVTVTLA